VSEVREESEPGIELAYLVQQSAFADVWDFHTRVGRREGEEGRDYLSRAPGMCVEGIRVRSTPAGYSDEGGAPWVFVNLTGRDAPRTNVARSDIEQTPELERALLRIYCLLGSHVQREFNRLLGKNAGIIEAAWEADYIIRFGLEWGRISNRGKFEEAVDSLRVIALEDTNVCRAVTKKELESFETIWTVDGRLVRNIEGISGALGIDMGAETIVKALGKQLKPAIPLPRILGSSTRPLRNLEVSSIRIHPEERSHRIDICCEKEKPGRWIVLPRSILERVCQDVRDDYESIQIARETRISSECSGYDVVIWRQQCLILATCGVPELLDVFGMTSQFAHWLAVLLEHGRIPKNERPLLKDQLAAAKGRQGEELLSRLTLPFERRFGDYRQSGRGSHIFS
jgi:hypothetical protein